jgi:pyruvate dehydrogenase E2 component (dihydrolipoamide acetyltransferase)
MAAEIVMPKVDMVMEDGTFIAWLKQEGDFVTKGDPLFVIGTDKADIEVEAPASGQLANLGAKPDDVVPVSHVIGYIVQPGDTVGATAGTAAKPPVEPTADTPGENQESPLLRSMDRVPPSPTLDADGQTQKLVRSTPLARAQARRMGLNLAEIPGSGARGRIHKADVERYVAALEAEASRSIGTEQQPVVEQSKTRLEVASTWPTPDANLHARKREPLRGARAIIAQRMALSANTIPHIHLTVQVDMSEAARLRQRVNPVLEKMIGLKASYTAIIARAVAYLLPQHPYLNSSLIDDEIILWQEVNLGIATNQADHLVVPVLREAQQMNLEKVVQEMGRLLDLTQKRKLSPADMKGSTFTLSNLGMYGIASFTAIVNPPEAAILAVGQIQETPVALNGEVVIRPMVSLTLAADHRIVDGAVVANFLGDLKKVLENPYLLI